MARSGRVGWPPRKAYLRPWPPSKAVARGRLPHDDAPETALVDFEDLAGRDVDVEGRGAATAFTGSRLVR